VTTDAEHLLEATVAKHLILVSCPIAILLLLPSESQKSTKIVKKLLQLPRLQTYARAGQRLPDSVNQKRTFARKSTVLKVAKKVLFYPNSSIQIFHHAPVDQNAV